MAHLASTGMLEGYRERVARGAHVAMGTLAIATADAILAGNDPWLFGGYNFVFNP